MYGRRKEAFESYRNNSVEMQSQGKLVHMLYEGVVRFCGQAERAIEASNMPEAHTNIIKAQNILNELMNTLKLDTGDVANQLLALYEYMVYQLIQANMHKKNQPQVSINLLKEVSGLMGDLAQTWKSIL